MAGKARKAVGRKAGRKAAAQRKAALERKVLAKPKAKPPAKPKTAAKTRTAAKPKTRGASPSVNKAGGRPGAGAKSAAKPSPAKLAVRKPAASLGAAAMSGIRAAVADLAAEIARTRSDIAALRPQDIRDLHLQAASDELDAIVSATEDATQKILDVAEALGAMAGQLGADHGGKVNDAVTQLFEACSFQDITGQRVTRVVKSLKAIEAKVDGLMGALGLAAAAPGGVSGAGGKPMTPQSDSPASLDESELLNGPQLPGAGRTQDEIDALMSKV